MTLAMHGVRRYTLGLLKLWGQVPAATRIGCDSTQQQVAEMFAIIEESGRQLRVAPGDVLEIDFQAEAQEGQELTFGQVLLANGGGASVIGRPVIASASVTASVVNPLTKGPKLYIQKMRRRKNYRRRTGHRQKYTTVKVTAINVPGLEVVESQAGAGPAK